MSQKPTPPPSLIFDWPRTLGSGGRLALAMLLVVVGLTGFFYVFQVVYPQSARFSPVPHEVFVLNPADPATNALLHKVQDRDFLLLPSNHSSEADASLNEAVPVFDPSFADHTVTLQDLPHRGFTAPPARLLDRDAPVLPVLDLQDLKQPERSSSDERSRGSFVVSMKISGIPVERLPSSLPQLKDVDLTDPESTVYKIGVDDQGRVVFALSLTSTEQPEVLKALGKKVRRLKFQPLKTANLTSEQPPVFGSIAFEWSSKP